MLETALETLRRACDEFGIPVEQAAMEKAHELSVRFFLRCIPNDRLKPHQHSDFLRQVLGRPPDVELLETIQERSERRSFSPQIRSELEARQNFRCALCGVVLTAEENPQVDHIVPLALRGSNDRSNLQLICRSCNIGKDKLLSWIMGAPFFDFPKRASTMSKKLRYCTLAYNKLTYGGRCREPDCDATPSSVAMQIIPKIAIQEGGRFIFDNLMVVCEQHGQEKALRLKERAQLRFKPPKLSFARSQ